MLLLHIRTKQNISHKQPHTHCWLVPSTGRIPTLSITQRSHFDNSNASPLLLPRTFVLLPAPDGFARVCGVFLPWLSAGAALLRLASFVWRRVRWSPHRTSRCRTPLARCPRSRAASCNSGPSGRQDRGHQRSRGLPTGSGCDSTRLTRAPKSHGSYGL